MEEGGFIYDSDAYNDELPYWLEFPNKAHLVIPYSLTTNDSKFGRGWFSTSDDFFKFNKDAFDLLYEEGKTAPKMMSIGLHQRLIGHPARAMGLKRFLDYIANFDDIWVCHRIDIAKHCLKRTPIRYSQKHRKFSVKIAVSFAIDNLINPISLLQMDPLR